MECISRTRRRVYKSFIGSYMYREGSLFIDCGCPDCRSKRKKSVEDHIWKELEYMRTIPHAFCAPTKYPYHA